MQALYILLWAGGKIYGRLTNAHDAKSIKYFMVSILKSFQVEFYSLKVKVAFISFMDILITIYLFVQSYQIYQISQI